VSDIWGVDHTMSGKVLIGRCSKKVYGVSSWPFGTDSRTVSPNSESEQPDRDFGGILTQYLVGFLQAATPEGTLEYVLRTAGETRTAAELSDPNTRSSYRWSASR
jgi:hypothetical protein